jgi:hypothetical protein
VRVGEKLVLEQFEVVVRGEVCKVSLRRHLAAYSCEFGRHLSTDRRKLSLGGTREVVDLVADALRTWL